MINKVEIRSGDNAKLIFKLDLVNKEIFDISYEGVAVRNLKNIFPCFDYNSFFTWAKHRLKNISLTDERVLEIININHLKGWPDILEVYIIE